jgi:Holliday junction resolvase RusA-like endonuclease
VTSIIIPDKLCFFVPGVPIPTQYRQTRTGVMYKSRKGKDWELTVQQAAIAAAGCGWKPWGGRVNLEIIFYFPIPKSRKELLPGMIHLQDPDSTNLLKNTEDGIKRVLFLDDNQVQITGITKIWRSQGKEGALITVEFE